MRIAYIKAADAIQRAVRCATGSFESVRLIETEREAERERKRERERETDRQTDRERAREMKGTRERKGCGCISSDDSGSRNEVPLNLSANK